MSFVNLPRLTRGDRSARRTPSPLGFETLEVRCVPATNLVDTNSGILGAGSGDAEVIATTSNGRYAVFSSTATDIVQGQNDTPGTRDLFWIDFETGRKQLVTNVPNDGGVDATGAPAYNYNKTITFGRAFADVEPFGMGRPATGGADVGRPVISDDGQYVSFISKVNAGALDSEYASKTQFSVSKRSLDSDRGNTSYDVFRWFRGSGQIELMSRTFPDARSGGLSMAFGARADAVLPAISLDGSKVAFVSKRDASFVYPFSATRTANPVLDNGDNSNDVFLSDGIAIEQGLPQTTTVVSRVTNPYGTDVTFASFFLREGSATQGFLANFAPEASIVWAQFKFVTDVNGNKTITDLLGNPAAVPSAAGVHVDPLGRYLSADGATLTFTSDMNARWFGPLYTTLKAFTNTAGKFDVNLYDVVNVGANGVSGRIASFTGSTLDSSKIATNFPESTLALQGGSADNSILALTTPDRVLFTARIGNSNEGALVSNAVVTAGTGVENQELYFRTFLPGSSIPARSRLVSAMQIANPDNPLTASVAGSGQLRPDPVIATTVDPRGYQITSSGRYVVFTDTSRDLVSIAFPGAGRSVTDSNGVSDVFRRDLDYTSSEPTGGLSLMSFTPQLSGTGKGASYNPTVTPDGRFVAFESLAANLVSGLDKNSQVVQVTNPITGAVTNVTTSAPDIYVTDQLASKNSRGIFLPRVSLASINSAGTAAGNAASTLPFIGSNGSIARVLFTSLASDLSSSLPVTGGQHGYVTDLPVNTAAGAVSTAVGIVTGGTPAAASLVSFTGNGIIAFGTKFTPFPNFNGELRAVTADVNGDGIPDVIVAAGPGGGPRVVVIDGATGGRTLTYNFTDVVTNPLVPVTTTTTRVFDFFAYESSFTGGIYLATADFNNDGYADIVVGAGEGGGPRVQVYSGRDGRKLADFFAYETSFRGGVRLGTGDLNPVINPQGVITGTTPDILTGAGLGGGPRVSVFDGAAIAAVFPIYGNIATPLAPTATPTALATAPPRLSDFFAYEPTVRNGVFVAGGDVDGDGRSDVVTGAGPGGGPRVIAFEATSLLTNPQRPTLLVNLFAFDSSSRNGVRVAVKDIDGNGSGDLLVGQGAGDQSRVRTFSVGDVNSKQDPVLVDDRLVYDDFGSLNGAWVG